MSTSKIYIELLIIGYLGIISIVYVLLLIYGIPNLENILNKIDELEFLISIILTSFAYYFGILLDRISDTLLYHWDKNIRKNFELDGEPSILEMQAKLFINSPESVRRYGYQQNRIRIIRASILILSVLLFILSFLLLHDRYSDLGSTNLPNHLFYVFAFWSLSLFTFSRITRSYWIRTKREFFAMTPPKKKN